jgi:hypothetical protein
MWAGYAVSVIGESRFIDYFCNLNWLLVLLFPVLPGGTRFAELDASVGSRQLVNSN